MQLLLPLRPLLVSALLVLPLVGLVGCSKPPSQAQLEQQKASAKPPFEMAVVELHQLSQLGSAHADGQFVMAHLKLKNATNADQALDPSALKIIHQPDVKKPPVYQQGPEAGVRFDFNKAYGVEAGKRLIGSLPETIHPQIEAERYVVFLLPNDAQLRDYQIFLKAPDYKAGGGGFIDNIGGAGGSQLLGDVKIPLISNQTKVEDHRQAEQPLSH